MSINKGLFTSNTPEWATPIALFKELDAEFHFNLDPCANESNHKCEKYFTAEEDGLKQTWGGILSFATHHTAGNYPNGCVSVMRSHASLTHRLSC